jgi:hypothetical protein
MPRALRSTAMNQPLYPLHQAAGDTATKSAGRRTLRAASQLLPLEQRFMFDGALAGAAGGAGDAAHAAEAAAAAAATAVTVRAADPAKDQGRKEVVLVDTSLAGYKTLEAGVRDGVGIVEFDGKADGLKQIAAWAGSQSGLDAIHILSHGSSGTLDLGTSRVTEASLGSAATQAELAELGQALNADGDLLLYGCDVAAGNGATLLAGLAKATGADVAASTDLTGAARLGGDWTLESHNGAIEARALALTDYAHVLAPVDLSTGYSAGATTFIKNVDGVDLTFTLIPGAGPGYGFFNDQFPGVVYVYAPSLTDNAGGFTITAPTGYTFDLTEVTGSIDGTVTYHPTGGGSSDAQHSDTVTYDGDGYPVTDTYTLSLAGMTSLTVTSAGDGGSHSGYLGLANMNLTVHSLKPTSTAISIALGNNQDTGSSASDLYTNYTGVATFSGDLSAVLTSTQKVQVSYDGGTWSDATHYATNSASWSTDTTLVAGAHTIMVRVAEIDSGATYGGDVYSRTYTLDTTVPTISFSTIRFSTDNGGSPTDLITDFGTQDIRATLSATPDAGDRIKVSIDGGTSYTDVTSFVTGTTLNWTNQTLSGSSSLRFKVTDKAGNDSTPTAHTYTIDTTPPLTTATSAALSEDTGTPGDRITRIDDQTISGQLSAVVADGETVQVSIANGAWTVATAAVGGSGWSLAGATLTGTTSTIRVKVVDLAGNDGAIDSFGYTLDTSVPGVSFNNVRLSADHGETSTDFITDTADQTITATLIGALDAGDIVQGSVNGVDWIDLTSKVSGATLTWDGVVLGTGGAVRLKITDLAGNDSVLFSKAYTVDTVKPATPTAPVLDPDSDSGASGDNITRDNTPTLTGTAEAGSTVKIYDGLTSLGSAIAGVDGKWSYTPGALGNRVYSFNITATDIAGNVSDRSAALAVTIDTAQPVVVSVDAPADRSYGAGSVLTFTVHVDENVIVDTANGRPGLLLRIGAGQYYAYYSGGSGTGALQFSYTVPAGQNDADGIEILALQANGGTLRDAADNNLTLTLQNVASTTGVLIDTTPPGATLIDVKLSADHGESDVDFITDTAAQTITATLNGTLNAGEIVYGSVNGVDWIDLSSKLSGVTLTWDGVTLGATGAVRLKVTDAAGNDGAVFSQTYTLDTVKPDAPGAPTLDANSDSGASNSDGVTGDNTPTLTGTAEADSTVSIYDGATLLGTVIADGGGAWNYTTGALGNAVHSFSVTATDVAGNVSDRSTTLAVTIDAVQPVVVSVDVPADRSYAAGAVLSFTVHAGENVIVDTTGGTPRLALDIGGVTRYASYVSGGGGGALLFRYTVQAGDNDANGIAVSALEANSGSLRDLAGNDLATALHGVAVTTGVLVDTAAPLVASVGVPDDATYYTGDTLEFTVNFAETVSVDTTGGSPRLALTLDSGTVYASYVSSAGGALTFRYTIVNGNQDADGIVVGALTLGGASVRDAAGNDAVVDLHNVGLTAGVLVDGSQPSVTGVDASSADDSYGAGRTVTITVSFSSAVDVDTFDGIPTLALAGGGSASYTGGSGGNTLTFSYVVGAGQNVADLDYSSSGALALNGATIRDAGGGHLAASLTLATPGAAGSLGAARDIVIDTAAPTNTVAGAEFSDDSGGSDSDFITNVTAQTISGTLAANLAAGESVYVQLVAGGAWVRATTTVGDNTWSLAGQTLTGSGTFQVRVSDAAGNNGAAYSQAYVLDNTPPTITFGDIALSADSGASDTDLVTNVAAQTISATLSAAPDAGDVVWGSLDGVLWTDVTAMVSGTTLSWTGVTLAASNTLQLRVTDAAGNDGAATLQAYVLDTTGSNTDVASVEFSADSGASGTDFITNVAAQTVRGTLSANLAAGETVAVSLDNGVTWSTATAVVGANTWSLAGQTLSASNTLLVKVVDRAGNDGAVLSQAYVYDTAATVPTVDPLTTPSTTPVLTGSATLAAGETLTVTVGGATYDVTPVAGAWSLDLSSAVPVSGALRLALNTQYSVTATVTDLAGNVASDLSTGELIVGTLTPPLNAPTTVATGAALSADSGASGGDFITNVAAQTIAGALSAPLAAGESVQVSLDGGATWQIAAASGGGWSLAGATLLSGANQLLIKVSNSDGDGPVFAQIYVLDTIAPAAPVVDTLTAPNTAPTLTGSATLDTGDKLSVSVGGATYDVAVVDGKWSLDLATAVPTVGTLALAVGAKYDVVATVTDLAGNRRADAGVDELTIAGVPTTVVSGVTLSADSGASNSDFITNVAAQTVSGALSAPLTAGQRIEISLDGGATWRSVAAAVGATAWSADVTLSGSNVFMARVSNDSGAGAVAQHAYVLDTAAPTASATSAAMAGEVLGGALSAPLGAGESVLVSRDGGVTWQTATATGARWSSPGAASGSVRVVVRDTAGNNGAVFTVDLGTPGEPPVQPPVEPPVEPPVQPPVEPPVEPPVQPPVEPPVEPPVVPPVPPVPVLPLPQVPIDATAADPAPADGGPGGIAPPGSPGAGLPSLGGQADTAPAIIGGVPTPTSPANPLAPASVVLSDTGALLSMFTPNGLPDLPFAGDMIMANRPIADLVVASGERISVQLAPDTFASSSNSSATGFQLSAQSSDGTPIPGWLKFDSRTGRFEGTPPAGFEGTLSFKVTARDSQGRVAVQTFKIVVTKDGTAAPVKSTSLDAPFVEPLGRSALSDQMRVARGAGADRLALLSRSVAVARERA